MNALGQCSRVNLTISAIRKSINGSLIQTRRCGRDNPSHAH